MIMKSLIVNKESARTLALSVLSVGALLTMSACSGDNSADTATTVSDNESTVATEESVVDTEPTVNDEADAAVADAPVTETAANVEADASAEPEMILAADAGAKLYESNCKICHDQGLLNAPKYGDTAAWSTRLSKGKETLYKHSAQGFNKMPAQANDKVSVAQVHAAVDYMLEPVS